MDGVFLTGSRRSAQRFCFSDYLTCPACPGVPWGLPWITRCPDLGAPCAPPPPYTPSQIGVGFSGVHPRSSQIGAGLRDFSPIGVELLLTSDPGDVPMSRDVGDSCDPLPAPFSQTPPRHRRFVANKRRTAIRPIDDRPVDFVFRCFLTRKLRLI
jgi:hypothetical protein